VKRRRSLFIAAGLVLAVVAGAVGGCGGSGGSAVQVHALWYGTTQSGATVGGVTPVDVSAVQDDPNTPLSVDLHGLAQSGAGPMWTAATAVAGVQAMLMSGTDPRLHQLSYSLHEEIDGPSAGGLLTVGSLAALRGSRPSDSTTMTGTILPDGSIGPVAGIGEKLKAAAAAGFHRVLIPAGVPAVADYRTGRMVDPMRLGRSLGLVVTPVASVHDAYFAMTGQATAPPPRTPPAIDPGLLRMLERRSRALIHSADSHPHSTQVSALVSAADTALSRHDPVLAFAASAEGAQAGRLDRAAAEVRAAAGHETLAQQTARVAREVQRSQASIRAQLDRTAETPVTQIAQLTALADTLSWGDFALTSLNVAQARLRHVRTEAQLEEIVRFVEVGRFEAAVYMPACAESLRYIGRHPITNVKDTVGLLNAYADLIGYAADANRRYATTIGLGTTDTSYLGELIAESDDLRHSTSTAFRNLQGPTALPALRMSVALLEYVETTQVVNDLTARNSRSENGPPNLQPIADPGIVQTQARVAAAIARRRVRVIDDAGLDPSFVEWNSRWGEDLSFRRLPNTTDEQVLHGLQFQWFSVLQSRLLTAMTGLDTAGN
jgi:hypothetical protein